MNTTHRSWYRGPRHSGRFALVVPAALLMLLVLVIPLGLLVYFGLLSGPDIDGPVTGAEWQRMFAQPNLYGRLLLRSLLIGIDVTIITLAIALPTAWAISRHVRRQGVVLTLIIVPALTSNLLLIYAIFVMIAPGSAFMSLLGSIGLVSASGGILYTKWAVLLMLSYLHLPLMIVAMFATVERIDQRTLNAAQSLGAGPIRRFIHVVLPMALPGLLAGLVIVFTPTTGSFVEAAILGGSDGMLFGTMIDSQLSTVNNQPRAAAMAMLLLVAIFTVLFVLQFVARQLAPGALRRKA